MVNETNKITTRELDVPLPSYIQSFYDGKMVDSEVIISRTYDGLQEYILVREPNCRPYTKISSYKGRLEPIKDSYTDQPRWLRGQFK